MSARKVNRHIIAGLAQTLGGLDAPYETFSAEKKVLELDYMWANG